MKFAIFALLFLASAPNCYPSEEGESDSSEERYVEASSRRGGTDLGGPNYQPDGSDGEGIESGGEARAGQDTTRSR